MALTLIVQFVVFPIDSFKFENPNIKKKGKIFSSAVMGSFIFGVASSFWLVVSEIVFHLPAANQLGNAIG